MRSLLDNPFTLALIIALSMVVLEYFWARTVQLVRDDRTIPAANSSAIFALVQSVVTIIYVNEPTMIPAVVVGAWIGTWIAVYRHKKELHEETNKTAAS